MCISSFLLCCTAAKGPQRNDKFLQKYTKRKNAHIEDPMCASIESSSFVAAGFGTTLSQVAGFHRAVPSTALDKACMQFAYILSKIFRLSSAISMFFANLFTILL